MILQTAIHASELDYDVRVVRDMCFSQGQPDLATEQVFMEKVLSRYCTAVKTREELMKVMAEQIIADIAHERTVREYEARATEGITEQVIQGITRAIGEQALHDVVGHVLPPR